MTAPDATALTARSVPVVWRLPSMAASEARSGSAGLAVVDLSPTEALQTCVPRGCDLVLLGVSGRVGLAPGCEIGSGELVLWPREQALTVRAVGHPARLAIVAVPAGAEQLLAALSRAALPPDAAVLLAADAGVDLVLPDAHPPDVGDAAGRSWPPTAGETAAAAPRAGR